MAAKMFVIAGELSGDAHGAGLLESLQTSHQNLEIHGVGGPKMAKISPMIRNWVEDAAVIGIWEVLKHYRWFQKQFQTMLQDMQTWQPDVLLLIDYPGFNLRMAKAVRKSLPNTKIIYYISPQVWAWNRARIPKMVHLIDEMLCLFPFEQEIFQNAGLPTTFVGHPLIDELEAEKNPKISRDPQLIGIFPGSRDREISRLFPIMLEAVRELLILQPNWRFEVPAASPKLEATILEMIEAAGLSRHIKTLQGKSHQLMQRANCGVIASGTATLEAAYFGLPYCLVYHVAWPTFLLGKMLVRIPHIGLVNILAQREVVEELIQADADPIIIADALIDLATNHPKRKKLQQDLAEVTQKLGKPGTHQRAAACVEKWLPKPH